MQLDDTTPNPSTTAGTTEELQESQLMEEDSESIDIGELDILGLEQACKSKSFDKIPDWEVSNLVEVLTQAQKHHSLGF